MTSVTVRGVTVDEDVDSPLVLSALTLPGITSRQSTSARIAGGSAFTGRSVGESGTLAFEAHVIADTTAQCMAYVDRIVAACGAPAGDDLLEVEVLIGGTVRAYVGRPASCVPVVDGTETAAARCTFTLTDPRWYGASHSVDVPVAAAGGGMTTPMDTPMVTVGGGVTGDVALTNNGSAPAPWTAELHGPWTDLRLMLDGKTITFVGDLADGQVATVDSRDESFLIGAQPLPWDTPDSLWWEIPPGQSTLSARASAGTGWVRVSWRDASW